MATEGFTPVIHRYTTPKYLTVNVFLVETEHGVVMIDGATAMSTSHEIRALIDEQIKKPLLGVLLTHGHPDHYVGVGEVVGGRDVPIVATRGTIDFAEYQDREKFEHLLRRNYGDDLPATRAFPNQVARDGDVLAFDGVAFALQDMGPCESGSDSIWRIDVEGVPHVFLGDLIYNHMHSYFRDGHALNWLRALDRLSQQFDHRAVLHPAHGETCGSEMFYWEKGYIQAFLATLRSLLAGGDSLDEAGKQVLVERMQSYLPTDKLIPLLKYELDETIRLLAAVREDEHVPVS